MDGEKKPYSVARNLIIVFDIILSILIIFFSYRIISTPLGSVAVIFGFIMLLTTLVLRLAQLW